MIPIIFEVKYNVLEIGMRVTKEQFAQTREKILAAASKLFLDKGFSGLGVAEVMNSAGFTHGGFYRHFQSKEHLTYETCKDLLERTKENWKRTISQHPDSPLEALLDHYLTIERLFNADSPCIFSQFSEDLAGQSHEIREVFSKGLSDLRDLLVGIVRCTEVVDREQHALMILSGMIGAASLARSTNDPAFAEALLSAARQKLFQDRAS